MREETGERILPFGAFSAAGVAAAPTPVRAAAVQQLAAAVAAALRTFSRGHRETVHRNERGNNTRAGNSRFATGDKSMLWYRDTYLHSAS